MKISINMPQVAANGLSENWLFKSSGDLHWQAICRSIGMRSGAISDESGARLYPTFVAISMRCSQPLSYIQENDELDTQIELANYGRSFFCSNVTMAANDMVIKLEMITAFAMRSKEGKNDLRKSSPPASAAYSCHELKEPPLLLDRAKLLRKKELTGILVLDREINVHDNGLGLTALYEPSPYSDFNGANLLYFASYPTICDTMERLLVKEHALAVLEDDWCLETSTMARDVYYYRNLDIGDLVKVRMNRFDEDSAGFFVSTTLLSGKDGLPIADVFTRKAKLRRQ